MSAEQASSPSAAAAVSEGQAEEINSDKMEVEQPGEAAEPVSSPKPVT